MAYNNANNGFQLLAGMHLLFSTSNQGGSGGNQGSSGGQGGSSGNNNDPTSVTAANEEKKEKIRVNEYIDQTVLKAGTRWEDVQKICNEA